MKYTVGENQLFDLIYKYLDELFTDSDIYWEWSDGYEGIIAGFIASNAHGEYNTLFEWIDKKYYEDLKKEGSNPTLFNKWLDLAPILTTGEVDEGGFLERMYSMFSDHWKPVFEQWFKDNYGDEFPVKTFVFFK